MVHVAGTVKIIKVQATESVSKALMSVDVQDASYPKLCIWNVSKPLKSLLVS